MPMMGAKVQLSNLGGDLEREKVHILAEVKVKRKSEKGNLEDDLKVQSKEKERQCSLCKSWQLVCLAFPQ